MKIWLDTCESAVVDHNNSERKKFDRSRRASIGTIKYFGEPQKILYRWNNVDWDDRVDYRSMWNSQPVNYENDFTGTM